MSTKFQQRHYETIAQLLQNAVALGGTVTDVIDAFALTFERDNYLFDRDRFLRACEPGANVRARVR